MVAELIQKVNYENKNCVLIVVENVVKAAGICQPEDFGQPH